MNEAKITVSQIDAEAYESALTELEKILEPSVSFLQSALYGRIQERSGKAVVYFSVSSPNQPILAAGLAVRYNAPLGMNYLYIPYGPTAIEWSQEMLAALRVFFQPIGRQLNCAFLRLDSDTLPEAGYLKLASDKTAKTASLQPRAEWLLNISGDPDDIFMGMHKHTRYNIRLAERAQAKTVIYHPSNAPVDVFFSLMQTTGERDRFSIFDKSYYQAYLAAMTEADGFVVITYIDEKPAATGLFVTHDDQAHYVFAGSSNDFRKIAPAYSVIWAAIKESQKRGCTLFNFGGITDSVKGQDWAGVTSFKKRFGGYALAHPNPIDIPLSPVRSALFKLYKNFR